MKTDAEIFPNAAQGMTVDEALAWEAEYCHDCIGDKLASRLAVKALAAEIKRRILLDGIEANNDKERALQLISSWARVSTFTGNPSVAARTFDDIGKSEFHNSEKKTC